MTIMVALHLVVAFAVSGVIPARARNIHGHMLSAAIVYQISRAGSGLAILTNLMPLGGQLEESPKMLADDIQENFRGVSKFWRLAPGVHSL
jgi:hypothetical protein